MLSMYIWNFYQISINFLSDLSVFGLFQKYLLICYVILVYMEFYGAQI